MGTATFFLPSTAYRGIHPRLSIPAAELGLPEQDWIPGSIHTGSDLQWFLQILEPLLIAVQMAGYTIPEIAVIGNAGGQFSGGLRYDSEGSRVIPMDETAIENEFGSLANGNVVFIATRAIQVNGSNGVENRSVSFETLDEWVSGSTGSWLKIEGASSGDFRAAFRAPVVSLTNKVIARLTSGSGLLNCYIPINWSLPPNLDDSAGALMSISYFLDVKGEPDDMICDLGAFSSPGTDLSRPYRFVTLYQRLDDRIKEGGNTSTDTEWFLTALRSTLTNSGQGQDDYRDVTFTAMLLEMHNRGVVNIVGDVVDGTKPSEAEISAILARPSPLSSEDIDILANFFNFGIFVQSHTAASRLSQEYQYQVDPLVRSRIIDGIITGCEWVSVYGPNGAQLAPEGTFEGYLKLFEPIFGTVIWEQSNGAQIGSFTHDLWGRWQPRLNNLALASKFHYGAAILFLNCADLDVQLEALDALTQYYLPAVVDLSNGLWRHSDLRPSSYVAPPGWSEWILSMMCDCFFRTSPLAQEEQRVRIKEGLQALVGDGVFTAHTVTVTDVNGVYGELLGTAVDQAAAGSALKEYGHITQGLARRYSDTDFAKRLSLPKLTGALFRLIESNRDNIQTVLRDIHSQAAMQATGGQNTAMNLAFRQGAWFMSDATQTYLGTLDVNERNQFEEEQLAILTILDPTTTERCLASSNNTALVSGVHEYLSSIDDQQIQEKLLETTSQFEGLELSATDLRNMTKMLRARFKIFEPFAYDHAFFWLDSTIDVAVARNLSRTGGFSELEIPSLLTRLKQLKDAGGRSLSNVAAAVSGSIALHQLWEKGFNQDLSSLGLVMDVATGAVAATELMAVVISSYISQPSLILSSNMFIQFSAWIGKISPFISVITNGYAAYNEYSNENYVTSGLFLGAALLNGYLAIEIFYGAASVTAVWGGPIVAVVAATLVVAVMVWRWLEEQEYLQTIKNYEALWDERVSMTPPLVIEVQELHVEVNQLVNSENLLATVLVQAGDDLDEPAWRPDFAEFVMIEQGGRTHLATRVPGFISDINMSIGQRLSADDIALTISPCLENALFTSHAGTVTQTFAQIGDLVEENDDLLEYESISGVTRTLQATHVGRVYEILMPQTEFQQGAIFARLRLDDLDVVVEGLR